MKKLEQEIVDRWYDTLDSWDDKFLDFAESLHIAKFGIEYKGGDENELYILFENGMNYSVDTEMRESDGEKQAEIIRQLAEYGVEFEE